MRQYYSDLLWSVKTQQEEAEYQETFDKVNRILKQLDSLS
ncbi:hypothetical protein O5833_29440 [Escherichia coli]|nr:hypothetical protein [Escherichia coli]